MIEMYEECIRKLAGRKSKKFINRKGCDVTNLVSSLLESARDVAIFDSLRKGVELPCLDVLK
jgi:hypothetical protein